MQPTYDSNGFVLPNVVVDVDGDGLADVVLLENVRPFNGGSGFGEAVAHVFRNRGDGRFGGPGSDAPACAFQAYDSIDIPIGTGGGIDNMSFDEGTATTLHDVDGDGLADFVWVDPNGLHVSIQAYNPGSGPVFNGPVNVATPTDLGCEQLVPGTGPGYGTPPQYISTYYPAQTILTFADVDAAGADDIIVEACG